MAHVRTETVASSNERAGIAARLKEAREYFGLSQQEVAVALSVPRTAITMIESGQRRVDSLELKALARLYQRPIAYFTGEAELPMSADAALLKQVSKLSDQDKIELLRFSEFLMQRSQAKNSR
jgi:transcriptional regulator with XRE-family HTH domain